MAEGDGQMKFVLWLKFAKPLSRDNWESNFDLDIDNAKLCDGGYSAELVLTKVPKMPKKL